MARSLRACVKGLILWAGCWEILPQAGVGWAIRFFGLSAD